MKNEMTESFSLQSQSCENVQQGTKIDCSLAAGWSSLLVQSFQHPACIEPYETLATPDQFIVLITGGNPLVESNSHRSRQKAQLRPGMGAMTAPGNTSRVRAQARETGGFESVHVYIPNFFFAEAADELRRAGASSKMEQPDTLSFDDPLIAQTVISLREALKSGAPNIYAESAARFLAIHLLSVHGGRGEPAATGGKPGVVTDRRLRRAIEYIEHYYAADLSLEEISAEAGISRFHFIRLFKENFGVTPYQYLVRRRMKAAAGFLKNGFDVQATALRCGYLNAGHFAANFQKYYGQTPSEYRTRISGRK